MSAEPCFVDNNVLIYAYDNQAGEKQRRAQERLTVLWSAGNGVLSVQVLQEFFNNAIRKLVDPIGIAKAKEIVKLYREWVVVPTTPEQVLSASDLMVAHRETSPESSKRSKPAAVHRVCIDEGNDPHRTFGEPLRV